MWTQGQGRVGEGRKISTSAGESKKSVVSPVKYKTEVNINYNMLGLYSNITFIPFMMLPQIQNIHY